MAVVVLLLAGMPTSASAAPGDPAVGLSVTPEEISWPDAPGFERRATVGTLDGRSFRSIRIEGRSRIGSRAIRLRFFRHADFPGQPERPFLAASTGCNSLGARYRISKGRLQWIGSIMQTEMGCGKVRESHDRWLIRQLKRGMKAKLNGKRLTLTHGKTRIVLRQIR